MPIRAKSPIVRKVEAKQTSFTRFVSARAGLEIGDAIAAGKVSTRCNPGPQWAPCLKAFAARNVYRKLASILEFSHRVEEDAR
ncbi:hypothetical protein EC9_24510 [Rosistilla ulvae]|uniref:Uncharacterized protein n=1 Tax=Rosistilla ulvae TaxID=1930277 RepID=A0A517M065_9BACT|nr:hypothetical protein EC9_24510 [Rosistilla ulvae]